MCGRWGIAEPPLAVILFFFLIFHYVYNFRVFQKNSTVFFANFKNEANFSSEFSPTPSNEARETRAQDFVKKWGATYVVGRPP